MTQKDDVGIAIGGILKRNGTVVDLSTATTLNIRVEKPSGATATWGASTTTDGTDGAWRYVTSASDLDESGTWKIQLAVITASSDYKSRVGTFEVFANLVWPGPTTAIVGATSGGSTVSGAIINAAEVIPALTETGDVTVFWYGQSLSRGGGTATPALTTTQPYDSLSAVSFTALVETTIEMSVSGINGLRGADDGTRVYLSSTHGVSGADAANLQKGGSTPTNWTSLIAQTTSVQTTRGAHTCAALCFVHGETDTDNDLAEGTYETFLTTLQSDFETDVQAITSQSRRPAVFLCQVHSFSTYSDDGDIAVAQYDAAAGNDYIVLVTPKYHLAYEADGVHLVNTGYRLLGDYYGQALAETFINARTWKPLQPASLVASGSTITITYDVPATRMGTETGGVPLAIDTTNVIAAHSAGASTSGFEISDGTPNPRYVTGVSVSGNEVTLTCNGDVRTGTNVEYALRTIDSSIGGPGTATNGLGSARGNLRDTSSATGENSGATLYNWGVSYRLPVTGGVAADATIATLIDDHAWTAGWACDGLASASAANWTEIRSGETANYSSGTYALLGSTGANASAAEIGTNRLSVALQNTSGVWRTSTSGIVDTTADQDIWIRYIGEVQRPASNGYLCWYGSTDANNRYYIQFQTDGDIAVVYGSSGANLTTTAVGLLPTTSKLSIVDIYIRKADRNGELDIRVACDGSHHSGGAASAGGANSGGDLSILGAFNDSQPLARDCVFFGIAIGHTAGLWSTALHDTEVAGL